MAGGKDKFQNVKKNFSFLSKPINRRVPKKNVSNKKTLGFSIFIYSFKSILSQIPSNLLPSIFHLFFIIDFAEIFLTFF